jgi:signal transduction histidine kinase
VPFELLLLAAWVGGIAVLRRRQELEQRLRVHVIDERLRIARELHDVVAHSLSAITVQAGYARLTLERDSTVTATALEAIENTGRETLDELRGLLGVLRTAPPPASALEPAPTLADLPALLRRVPQVRDGDAPALDAELVVVGEPRPLPPGLELAAYRIAQEALTNVVRHAGASHAVVRVEYGPEALRINVHDDGRGSRTSPSPEQGTGHGIVGMRERAALYGGDVSAGTGGDGGFEVLAVLPIHPAEVAVR